MCKDLSLENTGQEIPHNRGVAWAKEDGYRRRMNVAGGD